MNWSSKDTSKNTSGTCTAEVAGDEDFKSFEGNSFDFYLDEQLNRWHVSANSEKIPFDEYQNILLWLPNEGDVVERTYDIVAEFGAAGKANASWVKRTSSTYQPYDAIKGDVTITLNKARQTAELTFRFDAKNGTKEVSITEGKMKVEGMTSETKADPTNTVQCDISDAVTANFVSNNTSLLPWPESDSFPAHIRAWSQQLESKPNPMDYQLAFNIKNGLVPNKYVFSPGSREVRVTFIDVRQRRAWSGISGHITLTSIPEPETLEGELRGTFEFVATATLSDGSISSINVVAGTLNMKV